MENAAVLPDGSAFFTASLPLPADHWLYAPRAQGWDTGRDCMPDQPQPILTHDSREAVVAAVRYAVRAATMCGKETDFDPDALVRNAVVALCGFYGPPGLAVLPNAGLLEHAEDYDGPCACDMCLSYAEDDAAGAREQEPPQ